MSDYFLYGESRDVKAVAHTVSRGKILANVFDQKFYAMRAHNGAGDLRFPFDPQPFTALVNIVGDVGEDVLRIYAKELISHGCVQAVCRGDEAGILNDIFGDLSEEGGADSNGCTFTSMAIDDEPLEEAIEYFILPCGLASTGLLMVIGDSADFQAGVKSFKDSAGNMQKSLKEPVYVEEESVYFELVH